MRGRWEGTFQIKKIRGRWEGTPQKEMCGRWEGRPQKIVWACDSLLGIIRQKKQKNKNNKWTCSQRPNKYSNNSQYTKSNGNAKAQNKRMQKRQTKNKITKQKMCDGNKTFKKQRYHQYDNAGLSNVCRKKKGGERM